MAKAPKMNLAKIPERDLCMTPGYALEPLLLALQVEDDQPIPGLVWEPCAGEGILAQAISAAITKQKDWRYDVFVIETEITRSEDQDFFRYSEAPLQASTIITNPPYSIRGRFTAHALKLCPRVALLMPTETVSLAWFHQLVVQYGEPGIVWFSPRIDFKMPYKGWEGKGSQFPCAWFTWGWFKGQQFFHMDHWTKEYRKGHQK